MLLNSHDRQSLFRIDEAERYRPHVLLADIPNIKAGPAEVTVRNDGPPNHAIRVNDRGGGRVKIKFRISSVQYRFSIGLPAQICTNGLYNEKSRRFVITHRIQGLPIG